MERASGNSAELTPPADRARKAPASPAAPGADHEGDDLGPGHVDTGQGGGDLVVTHGTKRPSEPAAHQVPEQDQDDQRLPASWIQVSHSVGLTLAGPVGAGVFRPWSPPKTLLYWLVR